MKKIFLLTIFACSALWAHAQVAFLLRASNVESLDDGTDYSERAAAAWFKTEFVDTGKGAFVMTDAIPTDASTYQVMWINIDDNGSGALPDDAFTSDVITDIKTYVKAGGNLLLTKRASRIAAEIGRMTRTNSVVYYPDDKEYSDPVRNYVNARLGTSVIERNASKHPIFDNVPLNSSEEGHYLLSSTTPGKSYIWTEMERVDGKSRAANNTIDHLNEFQEGWNCQVLAVWGNVTDFCGPVIVEFFPKGDYKGSIISIGTRSYVWGSNNSNLANVKKLTSNALNYLAAGGNTYGYVMPYTLSELYSLSGDDGTYKPDYEAAKWFYDNYIVTNKGRFIHKEEAIPTGMKVLWVNNDRSAFTDRATFYNDLGGATFKDTLEAFVKSGGNVFLTMQATRLANDIGRISVAPEYRMNGWTEGGDNARYMTADFYALKDANESRVGLDRHNHSVYKYLPNSAWVIHNEHGQDVLCKWQLMDFTDANRRTDNNAIWENHWDGYADAVHLARATTFEENHHCVILGGYGHTTALDGVGFVEFYPYGDYNGTVIALGLHSYEWGTNNSLVANVQNLTKGVLQYLFVVDPRVPGCDNCFYYISE